MLNYIKKDITTITEGMIVHGVNTKKAMGSGVALALREKWPEIFKPYKQKCEQYAEHHQELLGQIIPVFVCNNTYTDTSNILLIVNAFTQLDYGRDGKVYADISAIKTALLSCADIGFKLKLPLYLPPIGCGLGGLDFEKDLKPVLEFIADEYPSVDIYVCDL